MQNSQQLLPSIFQNSISVYTGELTTQCIIGQVKRLKAAFPNSPASMYDILMERVKANGFTDDRLRAAVDDLIDTFKYPVPSIADIISFDKRVKFHTYKEVCDYMDKGGVWDDFELIFWGDRHFWVKATEHHLIKHLLVERK